MSCDEARRRFLQSGCAVTIAALGLPATSFARPIGDITGTGSGGERTYPIPATDGVDIDRKASIIIARAQGHLYAFALSCPHQNAAVKWIAKDQRFHCTKHDSEYTPDGKYVTGHATRNMDRFPVRRDGDALIVDRTKVFHSDKDAAAWAAASVTV